MRSFTFKQKLVGSMMAVVSGVTLVLLLIAERRLQSAHASGFKQQVETELSLFTALQEARLGALKEKCLAFGKNMRFVAFLNEPDTSTDPETAELFYDTISDEIGTSRYATRGVRVEFLRAYDSAGKMIPVPKPNPTTAQINDQLARLEKVIQSKEPQQVGYLSLRIGQSEPEIHELIVTKFIDPSEETVLGTLLLAVRLPLKAGVPGTALWADGQIHGSLPEGSIEAVQRVVEPAARRREPGGAFRFSSASVPHEGFFRAIDSETAFPPAYHVSVHSLQPLLEQKRELRAKAAQLGGLALAGAMAISLFLAHGLAVPINNLVRAAREIERGNYAVTVPIRTRDEVGRLTGSFNEMAAGLLLKEKYRSVLDMVADKSIAEDLIHGKIELGGEERIVSVLFCDIRGFTALTERMDPHEVIQMLNDHFTPLTRVVYEHHGAIDKFVGDLIMAIFGAPKSFGNDVENAARCALKMIEERAQLNVTSKHHITMGIGLATGKVVAGRMGSTDRLNYTVLGPRVNLASRLCGQAGRMEVVVDDETWARVREFAEGSLMPELRLKGFATPVQAYKLTALHARDQPKQPVAV